MTDRKLVLVGLCALGGFTLAGCGSSSPSPTAGPTPAIVTNPTASPSSTPGAGVSSGLPAGMVCSSPTPPPLLRMHVKVHDDSGGRKVLDSKPLVANVDHYCDKVGFGDWKFCDTRPEGNPERAACDYLVTGKAEDTGRWGPTWYYGKDLCAYSPASCANHATEQFMAVAKTTGTFESCAADGWPLAPNGTRCGTLELK